MFARARFHTTLDTPRRDIFTPEPRPASPRKQVLNSPRGQFASPSAPRTGPTSGLSRSGTVTDRINEKLRLANARRTGATHLASTPVMEEDSVSTTEDKQLLPPLPMTNPEPSTPVKSNRDSFSKPATQQKLVTSGLTSVDPSHPLLLAGLSLPLPELIRLMNEFESYLGLSLPPSASNPGGDQEDDYDLRSRTRTTIFGTFDNCFSGAELVVWLLEKLEGLGEDPERGNEAGEELLRWGLIRRVGVGRGWESDANTFYSLKDSVSLPPKLIENMNSGAQQ